MRRAVIDVGTNSIKLLVGDVRYDQVFPVYEEARQTRLGKGFYRDHRLQHEPICRTAEAVGDFVRLAQAKGARKLRVIATSAARDAINAEELLLAIRQASGQDTEVISGEKEADWAFEGITTDPELTEKPVLAMDAGGGSTEFVLGCGARRHFTQSCRLGTVRLLELLPHGDPPAFSQLAACRQWVESFLEKQVARELSAALERERSRAPARSCVQLVGAGGTATVLGCLEAKLQQFDRAAIERTRLSQDRLTWHAEQLWSLSLDQRKRVVGLPPNRADVILTGAVIYEIAVRVFGFEELRVSTRGVRFAALLDANMDANTVASVGKESPLDTPPL